MPIVPEATVQEDMDKHEPRDLIWLGCLMVVVSWVLTLALFYAVRAFFGRL